MSFKKGDKVRCINDDKTGYPKTLQVGWTYTVENAYSRDDRYVYLADKDDPYYANRFVLADDRELYKEKENNSKNMHNLKEGDKIRCVDVSNTGLLFKDKVYTFSKYDERNNSSEVKIWVKEIECPWIISRFALEEKINDNPVYLNLGCFQKPFPKPFINVDVRPQPETLCDVCDDVSVLSKFEDNSVDLIYGSHIFEHIPRNEVQSTLKNWRRVLKVGGILRLAVPDMAAIIQHYNRFKDIKVLQNMIFGSQHHPYDIHYNGYDERFLTETLVDAGFGNVKRWEWQTTFPTNFIDDYSSSYLPDGCKKYIYGANKRVVDLGGLLMSLNLECSKV